MNEPSKFLYKPGTKFYVANYYPAQNEISIIIYTICESTYTDDGWVRYKYLLTAPNIGGSFHTTSYSMTALEKAPMFENLDRSLYSVLTKMLPSCNKNTIIKFPDGSSEEVSDFGKQYRDLFKNLE